MTNPHSPPDADTSNAASPGDKKPRNPRKAPRRASAPAGAPASSPNVATALLTVGADGMVVPSPGTPHSADDAGQSPAADTAPSAVTNEAEAEVVPVLDGGADEDAVGDEAGAVDGGAGEGAEGDAASDESPASDPAEADEADDSPATTQPQADEPDVATTVEADQAPGDVRAVVTESRPAEPEPISTDSVNAAWTNDDAKAAESPVDASATNDADAEYKDQDSEPAAESGSDSTPEDDEESSTADGADNAETKSGEDSNEPATDSVPDKAQDAAPLSRRERRLAEQKAGPGVEPSEEKKNNAETKESGLVAAPAATDIPDTAQPSVTAEAAKPVRKRKRIAAMFKGLLALLVIAVVVAATGTVLAGQEDAVVGPSNTEVNRQAAWERTTTLLEQATKLGKSAPTPKLQEALGKTTADLAAQAIALGDGLPPHTAVAAATEPATATVESLALDLKASGTELLDHAATADQAMGRVFAAAGASQLLQGLQLGSAMGSVPAASEHSAARINFPLPTGPQCSSTLEPRPGITVDSALLAAAHGEQRAVYAYQVATTRIAEPQFRKASEMLQRHQQKLDLLNAELTVRCLPLAVSVAGFALDPSFTKTPAPALAGLEAELGAIYSELAALSTPAVTEESAGSKPSTSARPTASAAASGSAVEKPQPDTSAVQAANNGLLREMSVAWLLDSSAAQLYWGGTVGALAGMKP